MDDEDARRYADEVAAWIERGRTGPTPVLHIPGRALLPEDLPLSTADAGSRLVDEIQGDAATWEVGGRPLTLAEDAFDKPRRFLLNRHADAAGITGVGAVAWGTVYPDGWVSVCWQTNQRVRSWYETFDDVVHLHGASTSVEWLDV